MLHPKTKNLTDLQIGKWKVLKFIGYKEINNRRFPVWECKCNCGIVKEVRACSSLNGNSQSCGCIQKEKARITGKNSAKKYGEANFNYLYTNYQYRAKLKNMKFEINLNEFKQLTKQNCYICGCEPNNIINKEGYNGEYKYNGIDRLDNTKGYTLDNVKSCCGICNKAKRDLTQEEFEIWLNRIVAFRQI